MADDYITEQLANQKNNAIKAILADMIEEIFDRMNTFMEKGQLPHLTNNDIEEIKSIYAEKLEEL